MPIQSPRDLFVYDLSVMHSAEQGILNVLSQMEQNVQNPQLKQLFGDHVTTTQRQVTRIQECFRMMGEQPMNVTCHVVEGLQRDMQDFMQQQPGQSVIDMFALGTASKTKHYEIASYRILVQMARAMGAQQCASSLEDSLREEESTAQRVEQIISSVSSQIGQRMSP